VFPTWLWTEFLENTHDASERLQEPGESLSLQRGVNGDASAARHFVCRKQLADFVTGGETGSGTAEAVRDPFF
jgi:hypothetical protein